MSIGAYERQKRWSFGAWATGSCESLNMGTPEEQHMLLATGQSL